MDLPILRVDQYQIAMHPAKVKTIVCGRRWGKTVLGGTLVLNTLRQHGRVAWITPTFKNSRPLWRWCVNATAKEIQTGKIRLSRADRTLETRRGGFLGLYSADNIDSIRGEAFHLAVLDEAARIDEDARTDAIMPTLADYDGDEIIITSPKGKNWVYTEFLRGQEDGKQVMSWQAPTSDNPSPNIRQAFERAKGRVPERTFRQEWLAEFVEGGEVFRHIDRATTADEQQSAQPGHQYVFGIDFGRLEDYTVVSVMDVTEQSIVYIDRYNTIDWSMQVDRIAALYERFQPTVIIAERNSMGDPIINTLYERSLPVQPFVTTNATKQTVIDGLALAFERSQIRIVKHSILITELQSYMATQLPSGLVKYGAPSGLHDDCVMSCALAWYGGATGGMEFGAAE